MKHRIPEGVIQLWDVWLIRVLVILSLTLQIILSIFGHRRKYIPKLWISILVWLAYIIADWVATVALGKLSDAQVNNDNDKALGAIWAPLLLLHLGGPDSITAYSLEDNQLWTRHLLGLGVQMSVAIYVILMSWKHSWFSFMSFPALVAGIIKYGERTWVLKSVSGDKSGQIVPFGNFSIMNRNDYVGVVTFAGCYLKLFKIYMEQYDLRHTKVMRGRTINDIAKLLIDVLDINSFWNALEVEMGLMYDLLYTKASINYRKLGCILRCISFACSATVLVGLIFRVIYMMREEEKWHKVDIAITGVLLVGALALEIYAVFALHLTSDWAMLWLINCGRCEDVIELRRKIPWLFNKKKNWSNMIGQFDLLSFRLRLYKTHDTYSGRILGRLLGIIDCEVVFHRYVQKTFVHDSAHLQSAIFDYCQHLMSSSTCGGDVDEICGINDERELLRMLDLGDFDIPRRIALFHILTDVCYHFENDGSIVASDSPGFDEQNRETTRTLSHYMMYVLAIHPSLLSVSRTASDENLLWNIEFNGDYPHGARVDRWASFFHENFSIETAISYLEGKPRAERWKILKFVWLRMLFYAASKGQKDVHLQQLRQGGELLTLLWFFLPQCSKLVALSLDPGRIVDIIERIR